jgi:hypothetical protein
MKMLVEGRVVLVIRSKGTTHPAMCEVGKALAEESRTQINDGR